MNFKNLESLGSIERTLDEARTALNDPGKGLDTSEMKEVLGAFLGGGVGGTTSFITLYTLGTTGLSAAGITSGLATAGALMGGGMVAGVFVLALPVAALAAGGAILISRRNKRKLKEVKQILLRDAISKQNAIIRALEKEAEKDKSRIEYLTALNIALRRAINELRADLGIAA